MDEMFELINSEIDGELEDLLKGYIIKVKRIELNTLITYMSEININTLMIQKSSDGYYIKVDDKTVDKLY